MTRADNDLVDENVTVGERVTVNRRLPNEGRYGGSGRMNLEVGEVLIITRVYSQRLIVRTVRNIASPNYWQSDSPWSFSIDRGQLTYIDPNYVPPPPPPPPRKLGHKPEDTEELTYIDVNDPRIQWIWDDLGQYADKKNWCSEYDEICSHIGIPGRPRDFNVTRTLNGIQIRATVKARSQAEANEKFAQAMSAPSAPEPDLAPAA